jgi:hypothetical protein
MVDRQSNVFCPRLKKDVRYYKQGWQTEVCGDMVVNENME